MSEGPPRLEVLEVVDDDVVPGDAAAGNGAAPIHDAEGPALRSVGEARGGPRWRLTPSAPTMTGVTSAEQAMRRMVSSGRSMRQPASR